MIDLYEPHINEKKNTFRIQTSHNKLRRF